MTLSFTGRTVAVLVSPFFGSPFTTDQLTLPVLASSDDERGVGLVQEDGAVGIGEAAIDRVTAHHRDHGRILLGLVLPDDLAVVVEVERVDDVREGGVDVHHVADDEGRALVAAQHAGREGPGDLEVLDVRGVDLVELGIAGVGVVNRLKRLLGSDPGVRFKTSSLALTGSRSEA